MRQILALPTLLLTIPAMKPLCALLALPIFLPLLTLAEEPQNKPPVTDFLRLHSDDNAALLQTAVTRYEKAGVSVDLLGAVHIADEAYYKDLNNRFTKYDTLLFEMIGGENLVAGKMPAPKEGEDPLMDMIGTIYATMSKFLQLTDQKSKIDYSAKNFVHADLTHKEFTDLQAEKGESLLGFALAAGKQAQEDGQAAAKQPDMARLITAFLSGDSATLKIELMNSLGQGDDQIAAFAGDSVIIGDRNAKCLDVLDEQITGGKEKLGIFYGAAHYPDMEERLLKRGFKKTNHEWINAWDVAKPQPKPKPAEKPADEKKEAA
jgi:hypothetical protein